MISVDQLRRGLIAYAEKEMLPKLPTAKQWLVGAALAFEADLLPERLKQLASAPMVADWHIIAPNGDVDIDRLYGILRPIAERTGAAELPIPILGAIKLSVQDIDTIYRFIKEA